MKWTIRKILALASVYYAHMMEYRAEIFLWAISGTLPLILMGAWLQASQQADFGLESIEFARYFFSVFLVRQFTNIWVIWEFEKDIVRGKLSFRLLQPLDPVWHYVARHGTEKMTRIPFVCLFIIIFACLYPQAIWRPSFTNILLWILVVMMVFALRFTMQYTLAMLAFWTERASAIEQLIFLLYLFLSGYIAPLEVFPPVVREIALWTPFPYLIHFPASLLVGLPVDLGRGLAMITVWFTLFFILNRWLWRKGLKQYSGMGA